MATPQVEASTGRVPQAFANACVKTARTAVLSKGSEDQSPAGDPIEPRRFDSPTAYQ
jgi:hypothetical protein